MEILIRKDYYVRGVDGMCNAKEQMVHDWYKANAGKWVTVDTSCLFRDQYNVVDCHIRIMDGNVQAVRNDARIGLAKCSYCGRLIKAGDKCREWVEGTIPGISPSPCATAEKVEYTAENTFFIANPNGVADVVGCRVADEKKFGSFTLEQLGGSLNRYRLSNARQRFVFLWDAEKQMFWTGDFDRVNTPRKSLKRGHNKITASTFKENELIDYLNSLVK